MVSRRALLNVTSTKKKDTMLSVNGPIADGIQTLGPTRVVPFASGLGEPNTYLWVASAREPVQSSPSNPAFPADRPTRSRTTCFARMLTEKVELQTQSSKPWTWRRIVFEVKGVELLNYGVGFASGYSLTGIGYARLVGALFGNSASATIRNNLTATVFQGKPLVDWSSLMTAPTDPGRVTVHYDKTLRITSGNDEGVIRNLRFVHPFNKNITYADLEDGGGIEGSPYSTTAKPGMGNVFVWDIFMPHVTAVETADDLFYNPTATWYWHEK